MKGDKVNLEKRYIRATMYSVYVLYCLVAYVYFMNPRIDNDTTLFLLLCPTVFIFVERILGED